MYNILGYQWDNCTIFGDHPSLMRVQNALRLAAMVPDLKHVIAKLQIEVKAKQEQIDQLEDQLTWQTDL